MNDLIVPFHLGLGLVWLCVWLGSWFHEALHCFCGKAYKYLFGPVHHSPLTWWVLIGLELALAATGLMDENWISFLIWITGAAKESLSLWLHQKNDWLKRLRRMKRRFSIRLGGGLPHPA